jgi:hypothetical protein
MIGCCVSFHAAALITHPFAQLRLCLRLGAFDACTAKTNGLSVVALERIVQSRIETAGGRHLSLPFVLF